MPGFFWCELNPLYVSLDTVVLLHHGKDVPLLVKKGVKGLEGGPKLDLWIQISWNFEKSPSPILSYGAWVVGALTLATGQIHKTSCAV